MQSLVKVSFAVEPLRDFSQDEVSPPLGALSAARVQTSVCNGEGPSDIVDQTLESTRITGRSSWRRVALPVELATKTDFFLLA